MEFQRDSGIECSPQGDKKRIKVFMREFVNERTGKKENINCELHTKFKRFNIDKDKQDRIYFAPAREGICSGKVILIHIGLRQKADMPFAAVPFDINMRSYLQIP